MNEYNPKKIERKWQKVWEDNNSFVCELDKEKKKILRFRNVSIPIR